MDLLTGTPYEIGPETSARISAAVQQLQERVALLRKGGALDAATLERLRREWKFQQVHESASIEGNQLTLYETQIAIQRGITISGKPPEHSDEVRNLSDAIDYLETLARSDQPITEWEVRQVQSLVLGRGAPGSGAYRRIDVAISNSPHKPPGFLHVESQMNDFSSWLSQVHDLPTPMLAAVCHAWLVHIHPFRDGNGRTARAIMNLYLMRNGYPIVIIRRKDRQRYYEALRQSDEGDITSLVELIVDRCEDSLRQIDRIRAEVTGISLAVQEVLDREERRFRIWLYAIELLVSEIEDALKEVELKDRSFRVAFQRYDPPALEDYRALCKGDPGGNTWFAKVRIERAGQQHSILFWIGFASDQLRQLSRSQGGFPGLKISIPNPQPPPPWQLAGDEFPSSFRELGFDAGKFLALRRTSGGFQLDEYANALSLAHAFVKELIRGWFA